MTRDKTRTSRSPIATAFLFEGTDGLPGLVTGVSVLPLVRGGGDDRTAIARRRTVVGRELRAIGPRPHGHPELAGDRYATNFGRGGKWSSSTCRRDPDRRSDRRREVHDRPHLAHRLGIVRVVATDGSIREVMRSSSPPSSCRRSMSPRPDGNGRSGTHATFRRARRRVPRADGGVSVGIEALITRARPTARASSSKACNVVPGFSTPPRTGITSCRCRWSSRSRRRADTCTTSPPGRRAWPAAAVREQLRQHQEAPALHQSQALSHGVPIVPEPQLRPGDLGRARPRDGSRDGEDRQHAELGQQGGRRETVPGPADIEEIRAINRWGVLSDSPPTRRWS